MQTIPLAFYIVMLELSIGSYFVMYFLDIRNDTSFGFIRFQAILYLLLFTLLTWFTMRGFTSIHQLQLDGYNLDFSWLKLQEPALFWFMAAQAAYNVACFSKAWRVLRLIVGGIASASGLLALLAVGMGFRQLEAAHLGGSLTVLGFISGALALGGVSTAMLLGHWYLNMPTASGKPLEFATSLTMIGIVAQIAFGIFAGPSTYQFLPSTTPVPVPARVMKTTTGSTATTSFTAIQPTVTPVTPTSPVPHGVKFSQTILIILEYALGLGIPLILSSIALYLEKDRSFQSATGMLYIAVVFVFFGEILARNLFMQPMI